MIKGGKDLGRSWHVKIEEVDHNVGKDEHQVIFAPCYNRV